MPVLNEKKLTTKYSFALTAGGLLHQETMDVLDFLIEDRIKELSQAIKQSSVLKTNSQSSRTRIITEIRRRNKVADSEIWKWFKTNNSVEQKITLFYICLKSTPILYDFQKEVVLEKWRTLNLVVGKNDVLFFFDKKAQQHPAIDNWSETTREKAATVVIRILRETGVLKQNQLTPLDASNSFWQYFVEKGDAWFLELCLLPKLQRDQILELSK